MINLPPLREEPEEIIPLLNDFLKEMNKNIRLSEKLTEYLLCYHWPGNVKELKRFAETLPEKEFVDLKDINPDFFEEHCPYKEVVKQKRIKDKIECITQKYLKIFVEEYLEKGGDIKGLCREPGCSRAKVYEILKNLGIKTKFKRGRPKKCP